MKLAIQLKDNQMVLCYLRFKEQLDEFFETKDYHELLHVEDNIIDNNITAIE